MIHTFPELEAYRAANPHASNLDFHAGMEAAQDYTRDCLGCFDRLREINGLRKNIADALAGDHTFPTPEELFRYCDHEDGSIAILQTMPPRLRRQAYYLSKAPYVSLAKMGCDWRHMSPATRAKWEKAAALASRK